ncbi:putative sulfate exporter family transporter [uncultured Sneathiella sp.]|uniref:putative sulfate exporter family transporter n=1 Tax=uncultured Sneathiella sp. TaxID=879315 RepID=UPI0030DDCC48
MINLAFGIKVKMRLRFYYNECSDLFPGFLLCLTIAAAARLLSEHYSAPQMLFALLLGIAFHFLADEGKCAAGVQFSSKAVLRFGVALLGMRLTINDVVSLGWAPVGLIISGVGATIVVGILLSRLLGRRRRFGTLTGGGSCYLRSVCCSGYFSCPAEIEEQRKRHNLYRYRGYSSQYAGDGALSDCRQSSGA